jgi:hypothetical protein
MFSGPILDFLGTPRVFHCVCGAFVLRLAWYALFFPLTGLTWGSLLAEPLHGLT